MGHVARYLLLTLNQPSKGHGLCAHHIKDTPLRHQVQDDAQILRELLMFAVVIVMQRSVAVCPMVVYLLKHLIDFCYRHKLLTRVSTLGWCLEYSI
jgi:hypothetical protein